MYEFKNPSAYSKHGANIAYIFMYNVPHLSDVWIRKYCVITYGQRSTGTTCRLQEQSKNNNNLQTSEAELNRIQGSSPHVCVCVYIIMVNTNATIVTKPFSVFRRVTMISLLYRIPTWVVGQSINCARVRVYRDRKTIYFYYYYYIILVYQTLQNDRMIEYEATN